MHIILDCKGVQISYFSNRGNILRVPFQKNKKVDNEIVFKILKMDDKYGQPYLPLKMIAKVAREKVRSKKKSGMTYKRKKGMKKN
jgi:hypothetical protein